MSGPTLVGRPRVVLASELSLVAEAVGVGLASRGFEAALLPWSGEDHLQAAGDPIPRSGEDVGLLISDLNSWPRVRAALLLITQVRLPWLVLTSAPRGPMWGAVLDAGAGLVLPSNTRLETVCKAVVKAARGTLQTLPVEREVLVGMWIELIEQRALIGERVRTLTPREHEVLTMLHAGDSVARIAQLLEVSPATVRSQVKAVFRKLQVKSQLGAVAALDDVLELEPTERMEMRA